MAVVLVALAAIGDTPVKIRAGKVIKLPPPATAFSPPAMNDVVNIKKILRAVRAGGAVRFILL